MDVIGTPEQLPAFARTGLRWLFKIQNESDHPVPMPHEEPLTFDANEGYIFQPGDSRIVSEDESEFLCLKRQELKVVGVDKQDGKGFRPWPPPEGGLRQGGNGTEEFSLGTMQDLDGFGGEYARQQQQVMEQLSAQLARSEELNASLERRIAKLESLERRASTRKVTRKKKAARKGAASE